MKFYIHSDMVVVAQNYEMSDMANPQGYIFGESFYVVMEGKDGSRLAHKHHFIDDREGVEKLLEKVVAKGKINKKYWLYMVPSYGSEAYISSGQEAKTLAWEIRQG